LDTKTNLLHVLVVEDDAMVRLGIASYLRNSGYVVTEAGSGEQAIEMVRVPISVVFTDIKLGGSVTGWDVADAFRKAHPDIGVIYTSGQSHNALRRVPGSTFLPKPYLPSRVVELIERRAA
jgi:CheY-like chemotaxis protein